MSIQIDKNRLFGELRSKLEDLKSHDRGHEPIFFGVNNNEMYKSGSVVENGKLLRILEVEEWKRELSIYCASRITVKAIECFKGEVTQVVFLTDLLPDQAFELRYYALEWSGEVAKPEIGKEDKIDPRRNVIPRELTGYEYIDECIYIYAELKPLITTGWKSCCVCGIQRAETLRCTWNDELDFCSQACQSIAWSQRKHDEKTSVGGDTDETDYVRVDVESEEMKVLKAHLKAISM